MIDITTLINELRSNAAVYKGFLEADGIRLTRGIALQARAADALEAQEAKITEALAAIEPPGYYEAKPHKALRDLEYVRRILSADAPTERSVEVEAALGE